jgi:putative oxidoreductase
MTTTTFAPPRPVPAAPTWRRAITLLIATPADGAATLARLVLALVMLPHTLQHTGGWLGGFGYAKMMGYFGSLGIPAPLGFAAIAAEVVAPIALLVGIGGRLAAAALAAVMAVAAATVHAPNGFFMNWLGNLHGEGYEYHLLAAALAGVVIIRGSGRWSVDHQLTERA